MSTTYQASSRADGSRPADAGRSGTVTSQVLRDVARALCAGLHPLVTGPVGDVVLLNGAGSSLADALEVMGRSAFDVVARVNAAEGLVVVHGDDPSGEGSATGASQEVTSAQRSLGRAAVPERERRLRALRQVTAGGGSDPVEQLHDLLTQQQRSVLIIVEQADIVLQDPAQHDEPDRRRVALLQLALRRSAGVGTYRNTCVLLAGEQGEIPRVLGSGCEDLVEVAMGMPSRRERAAMIEVCFDQMHEAADVGDADRRALVEELASLTDGESLRSIQGLASTSGVGRYSVRDPKALVATFRYGERPDYWGHLASGLPELRDRLRARVFGQDHAIDEVMKVLAASALGMGIAGGALGGDTTPRSVMWFDGPTGVGKTETAKEICASLFGDSEALLRFDMTTFAEEHASERLMGAPPGYVGFEQGGELTNAVRRRPNSVILFDEIEKAHPRVLDRLMSIIDDGVIRDAQGRVTYFGEAVIIFTSNLGAAEIGVLLEQHGDDLCFEDVSRVSRNAVRNHLLSIGRPEIYGRVAPGVVPFDILRPAMIDAIAIKTASSITFSSGPRVVFDEVSLTSMAQAALASPAARALGGRQVRNVVRAKFQDLAQWLIETGNADAEGVSVRFVGERMEAAVDGAPFRRVESRPQQATIERCRFESLAVRETSEERR